MWRWAPLGPLPKLTRLGHLRGLRLFNSSDSSPDKKKKHPGGCLSFCCGDGRNWTAVQMKLATISTLHSLLCRGRPLLTRILESWQNICERFLDFGEARGKVARPYPEVISPHARSGREHEVSFRPSLSGVSESKVVDSKIWRSNWHCLCNYWFCSYDFRQI